MSVSIRVRAADLAEKAAAPELPPHIMQRGNRRQKTFFNENALLTMYCIVYII